MSVINECLAGSFEFVHKGKTYQVGYITQGVKADFEKRLFARAREAARELRDCMTSEEYASHLKAINDDYISGGYSFESSRGLAAIQSVKGMTLLCSLLFGCPEDEALRLIVERQADVVALLKPIFTESFPQPERGEATDEDSKKKSVAAA